MPTRMKGREVEEAVLVSVEEHSVFQGRQVNTNSRRLGSGWDQEVHLV